jgi:hypothetical protein
MDAQTDMVDSNLWSLRVLVDAALRAPLGPSAVSDSDSNSP